MKRTVIVVLLVGIAVGVLTPQTLWSKPYVSWT
jgi:hypothetical protein